MSLCSNNSGLSKIRIQSRKHKQNRIHRFQISKLQRSNFPCKEIFIFPNLLHFVTKSKPFSQQTFPFFFIIIIITTTIPLYSLLYALVNHYCYCSIQSSNRRKFLAILSMEDNQWNFYDHDPLLLTDVSLQQQQGTSSISHCSNSKILQFFSPIFSLFWNRKNL